LTINPHQKISLQKHNKRSEHWVVVKGSARITKGEDIFELNENQSTYIPLGIRHSIENPSNDELELIEVQSGDYLGEDDIQRFEDIYGRQDK
jgi:mannose-6-phosphate isomerase-like protein (cupin superfamily)